MYFTDLRKRRLVNMNHFSRLPEFEKEFSRLTQKYPSLESDLQIFERLLLQAPTGIGTNFTIIHSAPEIKIVKSRLSCRSLRKRSMRVIYAYHRKSIDFMYIEIYFKGEKENEDRQRIKEYLKNRG